MEVKLGSAQRFLERNGAVFSFRINCSLRRRSGRTRERLVSRLLWETSGRQASQQTCIHGRGVSTEKIFPSSCSRRCYIHYK
ncbi:hypothetical protein AMECASPLE_001689 [Ameca splendens]|uniref:Uncharacterized protein n=1 Tax=Ameca splendens TaxID=208324 RepID=A0ABV0ZHU8_9TELE